MTGHYPDRRRGLLYGRRTGPKLSAHQAALFDTLLPQLELRLERGRDSHNYFDRSVEDVWLEIGFGGGEHLLWQAERHPDIGLIGAEPYRNGVAKLLAKIAADAAGTKSTFLPRTHGRPGKATPLSSPSMGEEPSEAERSAAAGEVICTPPSGAPTRATSSMLGEENTGSARLADPNRQRAHANFRSPENLPRTAAPRGGEETTATCADRIRIHEGDARDILDALPDASLGRVFLLFPDPWPKKRHRKRRFVQMETLDALARAMKLGAELRFASDDEHYIAWTLEWALAHPAFEWTAVCAADWRARPADWPPTRYEEKALHGQPVFLRFRRRALQKAVAART